MGFTIIIIIFIIIIAEGNHYRDVIDRTRPTLLIATSFEMLIFDDRNSIFECTSRTHVQLADYERIAS